jgi:hypothetical protein
MEMDWKREDEEEKIRIKQEPLDRRNREAKAAELKRCQGELAIATSTREAIFARYRLSDEEIFQLTHKLAKSPEAFRDIGGTLCEFYATQIVDARNS